MSYRFFTLSMISGMLLTFSSGAQAQQKVGYVDSEEILMSLPEMKAAEQTFQNSQKQKQTALENMDKEIGLKIAQYESKYKTISEANREVVEKELNALGNQIEELKKKLEETTAKAQQELSEQQEKLYSPILQKTQSMIKTLAKEQGYAYVMDIAQPGILYYGGDDLTDTVKEKLLAAPAAAKK